MADLLTLSEYKSFQGIDPTNTRNDARVSALIPLVTSAIRSFTERDFGAPQVLEERVFEYDGSGYLDIDDASSVTSVSFTVPGAADIALDSTMWTAKPARRDDAPVHHYIYIGPAPGYGSPEMGFRYNLDRWSVEHGYAAPSLAKVMATWGWPDVPADVKLAAVWTIREWIDRPSGDALTAEAIEGWSRTWGGRSGAGAAASLAIPGRARDILVNYAKVSV